MNKNDDIIKLKEEVKSAIDKGNRAIDSADRIHQNIMEKLENLEEKISDIRVDIAGLPEKLAKEFDNRYASKNAEKAVYALIGALCLGVVYIMINHLLK